MSTNTCFVVLLCRKDYHYAKLCCESIRYYYPDVPILLIKDGRFPTGQLESLPGVSPLDVTGLEDEVRDFPGMLKKLQILFLKGYDRAFYLDADTVLVGPILDVLDGSDVFVNGYAENRFRPEAASPERQKWMAHSFFPLEALRAYDPDFVNEEVMFFVGGHFCVRPGVVPPDWVRRAAPHLDPSFHGGRLFKYGDQGIVNYLFNKAAQTGRATLGYAGYVIFPSAEGESRHPQVRPERLLDKKSTGHYLIHFTGPSRRFHYGSHRFGFVLSFFAKRYYARFPWYARPADYAGRVLRAVVWDNLCRLTRLFRAGR